MTSQETQAAAAPTGQDSISRFAGPGGYLLPVAAMVSLFFLFGFIAVLNDILVPHLKALFHLSNARAMLVQFYFHVPYFVMSIPAGWLIGKVGYKRGLTLALAVVGTGLFLFVPASQVVSYRLFLAALFVVGSGLTIAQVAANPYLAALGPEESAAARLNLGGGFNSLATTIGPRIGAHFIFIAAGASLLQQAKAVRVPYLAAAAFVGLLAVAIALMRFPEVIVRDSAAPRTGAGNPWRFRNLRWGALAIFFYVGAEVGVGALLINYLGEAAMGGISHSAAAYYVSAYWLCAMIGRFCGAVVMRKIPAERGLAFAATHAFTCVALGMAAPSMSFLGPHVAVSFAIWAVVCVGLFNSVMWPCIFPLSLRGLGPATSRGSGVLVSMVVGGAIIPVLQGKLADLWHGYRFTLVLELICYVYVLFFALRGSRPQLRQGADAIAP